MTQKLPPLPTEVWLQIASYIPEREMPKLYPLSRAFYELGMDAIYQELRIRAFTKGMVSRIQNASKKPFISRRILALDIHLDAFDALVASRAQSSLGLFASLFHRTQGPHDVTRLSAPEVSSILLNSVKYMSSLRRCRLRIPSYRHIYTYLPFIRALWEGVRGRVDDLALEVPGNVLNVVLPVSADSLLQVHALSLVLCDKLDGWGSSYASQLIANFFNQAALGLESLSLVSSPTTPVHHLRVIFTRLYQFPKLRQVHLDIQFDDITGYNIAQFLNVHGQHIHTLSLTPRISPNSDTTPLATLRLPALLKLTMNFELETTQFNRFWASGFLTFTSLTHLRIDAPALAHDRFSLICDAFGRRITSHQVHDVHFNLQVLNGLVFDRLAMSFAALRTLSITANFLSDPNESDTWDITGFAQDMKDRTYPAWSLHDITLSHPAQDYPEDPTTASYEAMRVAARSIPSVQSFYGWGNMVEPCDIRLERNAGNL
ncbi:hypothetical protein CCMSSC00406_0003515 [Pleurotus cornucopiae]|uniref:Uncharacterized protein n=1 Tax=Pleurotus cornucopiae TaxID=5321 RepID=A0ACB7J8B3_PLECO|nr:hypothetical protein CCMSSC00406_0003515 [Pleurotus cornucopiae]